MTVRVKQYKIQNFPNLKSAEVFYFSPSVNGNDKKKKKKN